MSLIGEIAFQKLIKSMPDLRKNGLRKTINEALHWASEENDVDLIDALEYQTPSFVPDGTRLKKCRYAECGRRAPIVEMWEIEDTSKITTEKMHKIEVWWLNNFEGYLPFFELWVTDRWGNNRNKVWSDYEFGYDKTESMFVPFYEEAIEAIFI